MDQKCYLGSIILGRVIRLRGASNVGSRNRYFFMIFYHILEAILDFRVADIRYVKSNTRNGFSMPKLEKKIVFDGLNS